VEEVGNSFDWGDLRIAPETRVFGADAPIGEDGRGFDYCEGGAAVCKGRSAGEGLAVVLRRVFRGEIAEGEGEIETV
jgi:hypothetical protein